jgi:tetratricopeptide (TPR) repeat protein
MPPILSPDLVSAQPQTAMQMGYQAYEQQNWSNTEAICRQLLAMWPEYAEALQLLSFALNATGRRTEGLVYQRHAVRLQPDNAGFRYNLAVSLNEAQFDNEAALQYRECLRLNPLHFDALWNYGEYLRMGEHFQEALTCFETILTNGRHYPAIHHRMAVCCGSLKQIERARELFAKENLEHFMPPANCAMSAWEQALMELSVKNFNDGWALYQRRFESQGLNKVFCHDFGVPEWTGQALHRQTLLVHGEQGLGDEMMFASLIPGLLQQLAQSGSRLVLAVKPGLVRLFRHSFPAATVLAHEISIQPADVTGLGVDVQCALGSLPYACKVDMNQFVPQAYLFPDPALVQHYSQRLRTLRPDIAHTLRVGVMWGSAPNLNLGKHATWAQQRSINLGLLEPLAQVPGITFVSLQNAERGAEAALAPALDLVDLSTEQTDFFETAALIANLDLVISVDTSVGHLAGGMGVDTLQPLMKRADWRHTGTSEASYWYPSVRYIRQTTPGNWYPVIDELTRRLAAGAQQRRAAGLFSAKAGA